MRISKVSIIGIFICLEVTGQQLKPFIGLTAPPLVTDSMCSIQNYLGNFEDSGYHIGDTVNDFTIYNLDFQALSLSETLKKGKPVLLISSSYTCPVFRDKIPAINDIAALYKNDVEIFVVYTVEAHPDIDISPYFGKVHTGSKNINAGILYRQPIVYGDRMDILADMLNKVTLDVPVFIDGPCNQWWSHFGPAPNNATLIDPNGIVQIKHAWFDREPDNIICNLKKYFDPNSICDSIQTGDSEFEFTMNTDTVTQGEVNSVLYVSGTIKNISNVPVNIEVRRLDNNLPANWLSSICLDLCYPTYVDSTMITLKSNEKIDLIIDFFTSDIPGKGKVRMGLKNVDDPQNKFIMTAIAITNEVTGTYQKDNSKTDVLVYPQPASSFMKIKTTAYNNYMLFDEKGIIYQRGSINDIQLIERKNIPPGLYFLKLSGDSGRSHYQTVIFN